MPTDATAQVEVTMDTDLDGLIKRFDDLGVNYDEMHAACYARVDESQKLLANWQACCMPLHAAAQRYRLAGGCRPMVQPQHA